MRVLAVALFATLSVFAGPAQLAPAAAADDPSLGQVQAQLAASRARLNALYDRAAATSRQYDGAVHELAEADRAVAREKQAARQARAALADQSAAVAALTVQQLQTQTGTAPVLTMLGHDDPRDILERASMYDSAAEAMTARIDDLAGRQAVHRVTERRLEKARDEQSQAVAQAAGARAAINSAIAESKRSTLAAEAEQIRLMRQVAQITATQAPPAPATSVPPVSVPPAAGPPGAVPPAAAPPPATPPAASAPPVVPAQPAPVPPSGDVSPDDDSVWDKIAKCESGGNWHINTGNGYYGGLQFSARTWHGIGGPGLPHEHPRETQIYYAKLLQKRYGWGQWECAWARFT
ncbi:MAG: transglycosylase family protein [Aeromicrobium sp.]